MKGTWFSICVAATALLCSTAAWSAAEVTIDKGQLRVESTDGNFAAKLGGRIQFDGYVTKPDKGSKFNSGVAENDSGTYFRRVELMLSGKAYGFHYLMVYNFASHSANGSAPGLYNAWISHDIGPGVLYVGQHRPWRSFDEMTSNKATLFMERDVNSANGLYGGRIYAQGLFYRIVERRSLLPDDSFFVGIAGYSLGNTVQGSAPTQGVGYNARIAYAPIVRRHEWLHFGISYTSDHAANSNPLFAQYSRYYGYKGDTQRVVDLRGTTSGSDNPNVGIIDGELAGAYGPFLLKGEYGVAQFHQAGTRDQTVRAYSIEGSVFLTGETRPYRVSQASMRLPKPIHSWGAVELAAGYNHISNNDFATGDVGNCHRGDSAAYPHSKINQCKVSSFTAAVNYYPNANVRFTLEYQRGDAVLGDVDALKDQPYTVQARAQLSW